MLLLFLPCKKIIAKSLLFLVYLQFVVTENDIGNLPFLDPSHVRLSFVYVFLEINIISPLVSHHIFMLFFIIDLLFHVRNFYILVVLEVVDGGHG